LAAAALAAINRPMVQTVTATGLAGRLVDHGERAELEFDTEDGPLVVAFPRTEVMKLLSHAAQLNRQPTPQPGVTVPIEAFPLAHFSLSGTETGDCVLVLQAADGGSYAFVFGRDHTQGLHQAFSAAVAAAPRSA
jgi:hypothetical protein